MNDPTTPGTVKAGWRTTEFWQSLLVQLITIAVAIGSIFKSNFNLNGVQAVVPSIAVFAAALTQAFYSHSRAVVKAAAQNSAAQAATGRAPAMQAAQPTSESGDAGAANAGSNGATQHWSANSASQPSITLTGFQLLKD
jgi:hypothetical protein